MLTVGYAMGGEPLTHGPFVGLEYQHVEMESFRQGGGPVQVRVGDHDIDSLRGLIGYRVNGNYGAFRPYASVAYAHEFEDGANRATASIGGAKFSVAGAELHSSILISAGLGYAFNDRLMLDLGYRGDLSTSDEGMSSHGVSLGLNYGF
jgi:outer membrane lipase/esterase